MTRIDRQHKLETLLSDIRACRECEANLPHGPRPVLRAHTKARVLIVSQAPGRKVHASGIPWDDPSGDRLRDWLNVDRATFYDETKFAILPMGFCYPGTAKSGDLPPRPECAELWHGKLVASLPNTNLTLLVGRYAQKYYLNTNGQTLTENVRKWKDYAPSVIPLPHPSPRNIAWFVCNRWFETELVPQLRHLVSDL